MRYARYCAYWAGREREREGFERDEVRPPHLSAGPMSPIGNRARSSPTHLAPGLALALDLHIDHDLQYFARPIPTQRQPFGDTFQRHPVRDELVDRKAPCCHPTLAE